MTDTVGTAMAAAQAERTKDYELRKLRREFVDMGRRAAEEIKMLRGRIASLQPKADAYDLLEKVVHHSLPGAQQGYGEDVAWRIEKAVEEVEAARNNQAEVIAPATTENVDAAMPDVAKHAHEV